ncbi:MAG: winged helix-turn-helix transcriptional regulator [Anaerolineae bacterium]|nr:winged helix-turn-helix transcriptional regulator [Anaerolineae bacterium]
MPTDQVEHRIERWLKQRGIRKNPFLIWTAEHDPNLPDYFVDNGFYTRLSSTPKPCVVFARRGCGKTAQRQMLASECLPDKKDSHSVAISYTYPNFERALSAADFDPFRVRSEHHVSELIRQVLITLEQAAKVQPSIHNGWHEPEIAGLWHGYLERFAPHLLKKQIVGTQVSLAHYGPTELFYGLGQLLRAGGLERALILVDGLDEFPLTAGQPSAMAAFIAPLLGTLAVVESGDFAFRFFLPEMAEARLRAQPWFRSDRLAALSLAWSTPDIQALISQRLTRTSLHRDQLVTSLGELCQEDLTDVIDRELAGMAEGLPRAAVALADMLLREHCKHLSVALRIAPQTWEQVKKEWIHRRADFVESPPLVLAQDGLQTSQKQKISAAGVPILYLDQATERIYLGDRQVVGVSALMWRVLLCLYQNQGRACGVALLEKEAWQSPEGTITDETVATLIKRLRDILGQATPSQGYIKTVKERGYQLYPEGFGFV